MEKKEKAEGTGCWDEANYKNHFDFYVLLATCFSLQKRLISRRAGRHCAPLSITALLALTIHLFKAEKTFDRVVTRFAARFFA